MIKVTQVENLRIFLARSSSVNESDCIGDKVDGMVNDMINLSFLLREFGKNSQKP